MTRSVRRRLVQRTAVAALLASGVGATMADEATRPYADGGYFEIGVGYFVSRSIKARVDGDGQRDVSRLGTLSLSGALRRGPFFLEARRGGLDGVSVGATLWYDRQHTLDVLAAHVPGTVDIGWSSGDDEPAQDERSRNDRLLSRESLLGMSGLRLRRFQGDSLLQLSTAIGWKHGNGVLSGLHLGRQWQWGNWSGQALVGVRHASSAFADFIYGVDEDEATERFARYRVPSTVFVEADVSVARPLARRLVWRSAARLRQFDDAVTDSPLVTGSRSWSLDTTLSYVF